jgi:hypothetical protein
MQQHEGESIEAIKALNPIRSLENLRKMVQKTELGVDLSIEY